MNRKKIYYVPGLISLIVLPVALLLYLNNHHVFDRFYALEINWGYPNQNAFSNPKEEEHFYETHAQRQYVNICLDDNKANNTIKLSFAHLQIRSLIEANDTKQGIHFELADNAPYEMLVRIIEMCKVEGVRTYFGRGNDIWIFNYTPLPQIKYTGPLLKVPDFTLCGSPGSVNATETNKFLKEFKFIKELPAKFLIPLLLFTGLVGLSKKRKVTS